MSEDMRKSDAEDVSRFNPFESRREMIRRERRSEEVIDSDLGAEDEDHVESSETESTVEEDSIALPDFSYEEEISTQDEAEILEVEDFEGESSGVFQRVKEKFSGDEEDRKIPPYFILGGIFILLVLAGLIFFLIFSNSQAVIPTAQKEAELYSNSACDIFIEKDLECITTWEFSDSVESGGFISQSLPAGEKVEKKTKIELLYSLGADEVTIPNFTGMKMNEAEEVVEELGLKMGEIEIIEDDSLETDLVISSSLEPGEVVRHGTIVDFTISSGDFIMPDWVGQTSEAVDIEAQEMRLELTYVEEESEGASGIVLSTEPAAGETTNDRDITVVISKMKEVKKVEIPDLTGKSREEAEAILAGAGFTKIMSAEVPTTIGEEGVFQTLPGAGQKISTDERVDLIIITIVETEE